MTVQGRGRGRRGRGIAAALLVAAGAASLSACELLTEPLGRSYRACGVYPAVPLDAHGSAHRAADYFDEVLLPEITSRSDRRALRREASRSRLFTFFRRGESLTFRGRSFEHGYLVRVEDGFHELWTHENELSGLESFCPVDGR